MNKNGKLLAVLFSISCASLFLLHLHTPLNKRIDNFINHYDYIETSLSLAMILFIFIMEILVLGWSNFSLKKLLFPDRSVVGDLIVGMVFYLNLGALVVAFFSLGLTKIIPRLLQDLIGINLLDHIIYCDRSHVSLKQMNVINKNVHS